MCFADNLFWRIVCPKLAVFWGNSVSGLQPVNHSTCPDAMEVHHWDVPHLTLHKPPFCTLFLGWEPGLGMHLALHLKRVSPVRFHVTK